MDRNKAKYAEMPSVEVSTLLSPMVLFRVILVERECSFVSALDSHRSTSIQQLAAE